MKDATPHILCVIYGTELYGSERGTLQALIALRYAGAKVSVVGSGRKPEGGQTGKTISELGFPLFLLPFGSHLKRSWMVHNREYRKMIFGRIRRCSVKFKRIRKTLKPTHIMLCGTSPLPFILPALLFDRTKVIYRMGDAGQRNSALHNWLWKRLVRKCSSIVAISDFIRIHIETHAGKRLQNTPVHVIRNIAPERQAILDRETVETLQTQKQEFQLVFVGQLTEKKGIHLLVDALIALDDSSVGCWVIGHSLANDDLEQELKSHIQHSKTRTQIEFKGYLEDPRPFYAAADWHIAPSVYEEPLGNVVQEAQREGTPSIISNRGGLTELVDHQQTGWILDEVTHQCIEQTIRFLKENCSSNQAMGHGAKMKFENYGFPEFQALWKNAINIP